MKKTTKAPRPDCETRHLFATPRWRKLRKGGWKTDFGARLPEIVILTISNEDFEEFRASSDRAKIRNINKRGIMKRDLIDIVLLKSKRRKRGACVLLMIYHTPESTGHIVPFPVG